MCFIITISLLLFYSIIKCSSSAKDVKCKKSVPECSKMIDSTDSVQYKKNCQQMLKNETMNSILQLHGFNAIHATFLLINTSRGREHGILQIASDENDRDTFQKIKRKSELFTVFHSTNTSVDLLAATINMDCIDSEENESGPLHCLYDTIPRAIATDSELNVGVRQRMVVIHEKLERRRALTAPMFSPAYFLQLELSLAVTALCIRMFKSLTINTLTYPKPRVVYPTNSKILNLVMSGCLLRMRQSDELISRSLRLLESTQNMISACTSPELQRLGHLGVTDVFAMDDEMLANIIRFEKNSSEYIQDWLDASIVGLNACESRSKFVTEKRTIIKVQLTEDQRSILKNFQDALKSLTSIKKEADIGAKVLLLESAIIPLLTSDVPLPPQFVEPIKTTIERVHRQRGAAAMKTALKLEVILLQATEFFNLTSPREERLFRMSSLFYRAVNLIQQRRDINNGNAFSNSRGFSDDSEKKQQQNSYNTLCIKRYVRFIRMNKIEAPTLIVWMDTLFNRCEKAFKKNVDYGTHCNSYSSQMESKYLLKIFDINYNFLMAMFPIIIVENHSKPNDDPISLFIQKFSETIFSVLTFIDLNEETIPPHVHADTPTYYRSVFKDMASMLAKYVVIGA